MYHDKYKAHELRQTNQVSGSATREAILQLSTCFITFIQVYIVSAAWLSLKPNTPLWDWQTNSRLSNLPIFTTSL